MAHADHEFTPGSFQSMINTWPPFVAQRVSVTGIGEDWSWVEVTTSPWASSSGTATSDHTAASVHGTSFHRSEVMRSSMARSSRAGRRLSTGTAS